MKAFVVNSYVLVAGICIALLAAEFAHTVFGVMGRRLIELMPK